MATWTKYDAPLGPSMMRRMGFLKPTSSCATWVASDGKKGHGYFAAACKGAVTTADTTPSATFKGHAVTTAFGTFLCALGSECTLAVRI